MRQQRSQPPPPPPPPTRGGVRSPLVAKKGRRQTQYTTMWPSSSLLRFPNLKDRKLRKTRPPALNQMPSPPAGRRPAPKYLANPLAVPSIRAFSCSSCVIDLDSDRRLSPSARTFVLARALHTRAASWSKQMGRPQGTGERGGKERREQRRGVVVTKRVDRCSGAKPRASRLCSQR